MCVVSVTEMVAGSSFHMLKVWNASRFNTLLVGGTYVKSHSALCQTTSHFRRYSLPARMANARLRAHADDIFKAAVTSVLPHTMVTNALKRDGNRLTIGNQKYILKHNVHVVAFGKAVIGMVRAADDILGDHIVDGVASVPWSIQDTMKRLGKW